MEKKRANQILTIVDNLLKTSLVHLNGLKNCTFSDATTKEHQLKGILSIHPENLAIAGRFFTNKYVFHRR